MRETRVVPGNETAWNNVNRTLRPILVVCENHMTVAIQIQQPHLVLHHNALVFGFALVVVVLVFPEGALVLLDRQLEMQVAMVETSLIAVRLRCPQIEATVSERRHKAQCHPFRHVHHSAAVRQWSLHRKVEADLEHGDRRVVHDVVKVEEALHRLRGEDWGGRTRSRAGAAGSEGHVARRRCRIGNNGRRCRPLCRAMDVASGNGQQEKNPGSTSQTKRGHCCGSLRPVDGGVWGERR